LILDKEREREVEGISNQQGFMGKSSSQTRMIEKLCKVLR